jgi:hypothetical protein
MALSFEMFGNVNQNKKMAHCMPRGDDLFWATHSSSPEDYAT